MAVTKRVHDSLWFTLAEAMHAESMFHPLKHKGVGRGKRGRQKVCICALVGLVTKVTLFQMSRLSPGVVCRPPPPTSRCAVSHMAWDPIEIGVPTTPFYSTSEPLKDTYGVRRLIV
ncbi:hypothetical protein CRG98_037054 [Punica granatum]|uniref:Uncharacterized protein n=1 Tax=Punica granatum TaxID=22663 RepID=A0A2I0IGS3_PUNGR|nr:hypothetical protein CRG98_037054 [Punica granatum]